MNDDLQYSILKPDRDMAAFVESFWMLRSTPGSNKEVVVLPDGRIDLFFSRSATEPFHITLLGIGTHAGQAIIPADTLTFAISFRLLAAEYILGDTVAPLLNEAKNLPPDFWGFSSDDLDDFDAFCKKASQKIRSSLPDRPDNRKLELFDLIYSADGARTVQELSEKVFWSSRQINRYFNRQYGLSLKAYCNILRFRASFSHIKEGKLFPQENFADQSHFIKEIKKLSGVLPKELKQNPNGRFIQFSTLGRK